MYMRWCILLRISHVLLYISVHARSRIHLCAYLHLYLFTYQSTYLSTDLSINLFYVSIHPSIHPSIYPSFHPSIHPSIHPVILTYPSTYCVYLSTYPIYLSIDLSTDLSIYLSIHPRIHLFTNSYMHTYMVPFFSSETLQRPQQGQNLIPSQVNAPVLDSEALTGQESSGDVPALDSESSLKPQIPVKFKEKLESGQDLELKL